MDLFRTKPLAKLLLQASDSSHGLKRTLTARGLIALGIGAIIGAGLFVRTAAASGEAAGPAVVLSFVFAAIGCLFAGLCYAEFASMIPIAGSAYTYAYTTMGELVAWIIGWALVLEYAFGAGTVSIAWSEYLNKLTGGAIPYAWCHSPFEAEPGTGVHGIMDVPALFIVLILTLLLIKGTSESATVNAIIVAMKVGIVLAFIAIGWSFISPANHTPFLIPEGIKGHEGFFQHGWGGVLRGAGIVFFAFIGFDAVSTAAQETINPGRDMPIGILGSLAVCTVLYILFGWVLTGVAPYPEFLQAGKEASVAYAIQHHMPGFGWLATLVTVAILAGFLVGDPGHADGRKPRVLHHGLRRPAARYVLRRSPEIPHALQIEHHRVLLRGDSFVLRAWRSAGRPNRHRHAVRLRAGMRRCMDSASEEPGTAPAFQNSAGAAGSDPGRAVLHHDDRFARQLHPACRLHLDVDRLGGLLPLRANP